MLGFLTNLVDRFIIARIIEVKNQEQADVSAAAAATRSTKKRKNIQYKFSMELFDTDIQNDQLVKILPVDFACLTIANWLMKCSTDPNFDCQNTKYTEGQDPYDLTPFYTTNEHLCTLFNDPNTSYDILDEFKDRMHAVCETIEEKSQFIANHFNSEFQSLFIPDFQASRQMEAPLSRLSMYA